MSRRSNLFGVGISAAPPAGLPAWADYTALPNGTFREFTLNRPVDTVNAPGVTDDYIKDFFDSWCGGAFLRDYSVYGGVGYHGGGRHGGTPNNPGVMMLNLATRQYEWVCKTNFHLQPNVANYPTQALTGSPTDDFGYFQDDGTAASPHTYNSICEWPASWGGGTKGSLVRGGNTAGDSTTLTIATGESQDGYGSIGRFDVSQEFGGHSRISGVIEHRPGIPQQGNYFGACTDHTRQGWFTGVMGAGGGHGDTMFVSKTGAITRYTGLSNSNRYEGIFHHFGEQGQDVLLRCSDFDSTSFLHIADMSLATPTWINKSSTVSNVANMVPFGTNGPGSSDSVGTAGIRWSTLLNCFVWMDYRTTINTGLGVRIGKLIPSNPSNILGSTWDVQIETVTSQDGSRLRQIDQGQVLADEASYTGTYGRLLEAPLLRSLVWSRGSGHKGILIRLQGM
jgi:hypothetical protein